MELTQHAAWSTFLFEFFSNKFLLFQHSSILVILNPSVKCVIIRYGPPKGTDGLSSEQNVTHISDQKNNT